MDTGSRSVQVPNMTGPITGRRSVQVPDLLLRHPKWHPKRHLKRHPKRGDKAHRTAFNKRTGPRSVQVPDITGSRSIQVPDITGPWSLQVPDTTGPRSAPEIILHAIEMEEELCSLLGSGSANQPNINFKLSPELKPTFLARDCTLPEFLKFGDTFVIYMGSAGTAIPGDAVFSHSRFHMDPYWYTELK